MDPLIIPIVAMVIPIIIVPTALGIKHARFLREVEHAERMRAMELGRTLAGDESWTPAGLAASIGAGVPIAAMLVAFVMTRSILDPASVEAITKMAGMIGLGGVICGTVLAAQQFGRRQPAAPVDSFAEKPSYDPDAFDVVGRRG
jgi:hypothetical protein